MNNDAPSFDSLINVDRISQVDHADPLVTTAVLPVVGDHPAPQFRRERREAELREVEAKQSTSQWWRRVSRTQWLASVASGVVLAVAAFLVLLATVPSPPTPAVYYPSSAPDQSQSSSTFPLSTGSADSFTLHDAPVANANPSAGASPGTTAPAPSKKPGPAQGATVPGPTGNIVTPTPTPTPTPTATPTATPTPTPTPTPSPTTPVPPTIP